MVYESDISLKLYLREINQTPLLTLEEEGKLVNRLLAWDLEAREHIIRANLRLVVKIAHEYSQYGVPLTDLISEWNMGLMKAVERFDPEKWGKVSTYAGWWIKQAIKHALAHQSKTIRLPVHMVDKIARLRRIGVQLTEELWREATDGEISELTGISETSIRRLKNASQRQTSLDAPISDDEETTHGELLSDANAHNPLEMLEDKNIHGELSGLLSLLNDRERKIIEVRFGLNGNREPKTLDEVGTMFGITRERIRQLQNIALSKMSRGLKKVEKTSSTPSNRNELISDAQSIIAILRAEWRQKEIQVLLASKKYKNGTKEKLLRGTPIWETGKNWYECIVATLQILRRAQWDENWKKTEIRWSDIETFLIANIIPSDTSDTTEA